MWPLIRSLYGNTHDLVRNFIRTYWLVFLCCSLLLARGGSASAQDAIFSQHFAIPLYLNPAFAGADACARLALNHRSMPVAGVSAFSTSLLSLDSYIPELQGGIALMAMRDNQDGLQQLLELAGVYAYHLRVSNKARMHFGVQAGYRSAWLGELRFAEDESWRAPAPIHAFDLGGGWLFYTPGFYAGLAVHHLNRPRMGWEKEHAVRIDWKYTAHLGMHITPSPIHRAHTRSFDFFVSPNLIVQHQGGFGRDGETAGFTRINLGLYGGMGLHGQPDQVMAGLWYRRDLNQSRVGNMDPQHAVVFLLGLKLGRFRVGYSYDRALETPLRAHEISLSLYFLCPPESLRENIINMPAF